MVSIFLALLFSSGAPAASVLAAPTAPRPTKPPVQRSLRPAHPFTPEQALRQDQAQPHGPDSRPLTSGADALPKAGPLRHQFPRWLAHTGAGRPSFSRLPLRVLFCTWLT